MQKERVSDNVYWFQSEVYAQVTAGVIIGPQWAILIDTLMPEETPEIKSYIEDELMVPVRYIINTHHHADHCWGNCVFPNATVIGHELCRELMLSRSQSALAEAGQDNPLFRSLCIQEPQITISQGSLILRIGKKHIKVFATPGHSEDGVSVLLEDDRILFSGDAYMPIPYFVGGDIDILTHTITQIGSMGLENIIQGHGDVVLRGEIDEVTNSHLDYLRSVRKLVKTAHRRRDPLGFLRSQSVEDSGKSRISMAGLAQDLHIRNLQWLYLTELKKMKSESDE
ncbi:MAG: MBL fold metallo-hydrolase [Anaerolineaceae bacterium]|nr:MBL fold metallo-hydrolase [Anaerolineaceae bacterium]MDD4042043.1 MBL fold metallo-hydrolase [Anaerolineaceae bacterium]MDD4578547.1 MBL fold metallo-hydrolase [Anaerolineaceae bacterium]